MTAPRGFARLTPAQRAEVSRKGGRAAQASGFANQFTKRSARAAGLKSAEKRRGDSMGKAYYWFAGAGTIDLALRQTHVDTCSHAGRCDADVQRVSREPEIRQQLDRVKPQALREALSEYGAWDEDELADHEQNLQRILWIACCDVSEQPEVYT